MADAYGTIDIQKLFSYGDDLAEVLKDKRDFNHLMHCLQHFDALRSSSDVDFAEAQNLLRDKLLVLDASDSVCALASFICEADYEKKVDVCKKKTEEVKSEAVAVADEELDLLLQRELNEGVDGEHLLMEELRDISSEIDVLEHQRVAVLEKKKMLKKQKQDEFRVQMKLSMYASVTKLYQTWMMSQESWAILRIGIRKRYKTLKLTQKR